MSMRASAPLALRPPTLVGADLTTFSIVGGLAVALINTPLPPNVDPDPSAYGLADFAGASVLSAGSTGGLVGLDPLTGDLLVTLKDPAGGWRWITTSLMNLPQTIYGFMMTEPTPSNCWAIQDLDSGPIMLSAAGQSIILGTVNVRFPAGYLG